MDLKINGYLKKFKDEFCTWFTNDRKLALIVSCIMGFITHIMMITSTIMSQDGLWNSIRYAKPGDWEITLGRWGIYLIEKIDFFMAIPSITTVFCIIIMAMTSMFVIDLFEIKRKYSVIIVAVLFAVAPTFLVTLLYIYTALAYCINFLLSILVVWFIFKIKNKKLGFFLSCISFIFSLGIYQSYIGVSIGVFVMLCILKLLRADEDYKEVFINIIKVMITVVVAATIYYILTNFILALLKLQPSKYKNANSTNIITIIAGLGTSIKMAYKDFASFYVRDRIIYNTNYHRNIAYIILFAVTGVFCIDKYIEIAKEEISKKDKIIRILFISALILSLPIVLNVIDLIVPNNQIYALTSSQMILMIPFCIAIIEKVDKYFILKVVSIASCFYILFTFYITDNVSYTALKLTYNQAYSTTIRAIDRAENLIGYKKDLPYMFAGIVGNDNYPRTNSLYNFTACDIVNNTVFHYTYGGEVATWANFLKIFLGLDVNLCDDNTYKLILESSEFKEMGTFPDQSAVKIIDGVVVVKFHDNPPAP